MPRNMSFALTTEQVINREKTVTRRFGWWFLEPGDIVNACEKCMGLQKGEKINKLCQIRITDVRKEPLNEITKEDCIAEGFPKFEPAFFEAITFIMRKHGIGKTAIYDIINRKTWTHI